MGGGDEDTARMTALVRGRVQGVGFRYWVREQAQSIGIAGSATNLRDGRVEVVAQGPRDAVADLLAALRGAGTPGAVVDVVDRWSEPDADVSGFRIG